MNDQNVSTTFSVNQAPEEIEDRGPMLLKDKVAVVFGAGGAIGGAVARTFAREGASVFLSGRHLPPVQAVASEIVGAGRRAEVAQVDALDEEAVERYVADVAQTVGGIDVAFNAMGIQPVQGTPLIDMTVEDFISPISRWTSTQFLTARAVARHMVSKRSGVILTLSASPARLAIALGGGLGAACSAVEALTRSLAAELGPQGVRVVCLRPHRIGDSGLNADPRMQEQEFRAFLENMTLLKRLPTLDDVANTAAFLASDRAAAMTGTVANLTCGMID